MATYINQNTSETQTNSAGSVSPKPETGDSPLYRMNGEVIDNNIVIRNVRISKTYKLCKELCDSLYANEPIWSTRLQAILDSAKYSPVTTNNTGVGERKNAAAIVDLYNKTIAAIDALVSEIQKHINSLPETQRKQQEAAGYNAALLGAPGSSSIEDTAVRETSDLSAQSSAISEQGLQLGLGITSSLLQLANLGITTFGTAASKKQISEQILQAGQIALSSINETRKANGYEPLTSLDEVGSSPTFQQDVNSPTFLRNKNTQKRLSQAEEIAAEEQNKAYIDWKAIQSGNNPWLGTPNESLFEKFNAANRDLGFLALGRYYQDKLNNYFSSELENTYLSLKQSYADKIDANAAADSFNATSLATKYQQEVFQSIAKFEHTLNSYKQETLKSWIKEAKSGSFIHSALLMEAGTYLDVPFQSTLIGIGSSGGFAESIDKRINETIDTIKSWF